MNPLTLALYFLTLSTVMGNFSMKLASTVSATAIVASAMSASLVSAASEFLPYAEALAKNKVINAQSTEAGYRLNDYITRAELAKVAANLGQYTSVSCTGNVYTDVTKSLGDLCDAIETLAAAKVVSTANTTFRPNANVTRAEMTKMILGALGETQSMTSAGYSDVNSTLGDLEGFINKAAEKGIVNKGMYFRPNANGSRGEVFKIAAKAANLPVVTPDNNSGTTVVAGTLAISQVGSASAQYVPLNASSVKVGTVKLTANGGDATVNNVTVSRSGLGEVRGLRASLAQNGVVVGNARTFNNSSQEVVIRLNTPVVLKAGQSLDLDVLASLPSDGTPNSQHQFAVTAVNGMTVSSVTLGLLNTTSYKTAEVKVTNLTAEDVRSGLTSARIANLTVEAPSNRDVTVGGFTISKNSGNDLTQAIADVKVFRNGAEVADAKATVSSDKIVVTGLNTKLKAGESAKYELRANTIYVGDTTNVEYKLAISNTEDVSATEDSTGYVTRVNADAISAGATLKMSGIKVNTSLVDTTTKNVAPGTTSVNLLDGKITSSASFEVRGFTLTPTFNGASAAVTSTQLKDVFSSLTLDVAGTTYDLLDGTPAINTAGKFVYGNSESFFVDAGKDSVVRVRGSVKQGVNTTTYKNVKFVFALTQLKNLDNGNTFSYSKDLAGNTINLRSATLDVRNSTVAAPSSRNITSNRNNVEIGRFALEAKNADVRVSKVTIKNTASNPVSSFVALADNSSSFRIYDLADRNVEVDATKDLTDTNATLTFEFTPALTIKAGTAKNFVLTADTKAFDSAEMGKKFKAEFAVKNTDITTDNGEVTFAATGTEDKVSGEEYTTAITMPTLKVSPVTLNANSPVAKIELTNQDADNYLQLKKIKIRVQARSTSNGSAVDFSTAKVCLRNEGASVACETAEVIDATAGVVNGAVLEFTLTDAINAGKVLSTNSNAQFEVYLNNAPLWVAGDHVGVSVEEAEYSYGETTGVGTDLTDTYVGVADASATSTK